MDTSVRTSCRRKHQLDVEIWNCCTVGCDVVMRSAMPGLAEMKLAVPWLLMTGVVSSRGGTVVAEWWASGRWDVPLAMLSCVMLYYAQLKSALPVFWKGFFWCCLVSWQICLMSQTEMNCGSSVQSSLCCAVFQSRPGCCPGRVSSSVLTYFVSAPVACKLADFGCSCLC